LDLLVSYGESFTVFAPPQSHPSNIFQSQVGDEEEIASTDREDWRLEVPLQQVSAKPYNGRDSNGYPVE